jgi:cytoplasmic iron level regulating protein YaaA (DUF328/UPF0246 family)
MIITITLDDEKEDELDKFNKMMKAEELVAAIETVLGKISNCLKWEEISNEKQEAIEEFRGILWAELQDRGLTNLF